MRKRSNLTTVLNLSCLKTVGLLGFFIPALFIPLTSCSLSTPKAEGNVQVQELSLFMSRKSLSGTEFEQYKLGAGGDLFVECGKILGGRYIPTFQKMSALSPESQKQVNQALSIAVSTEKYKKGAFDKPGANSSFFDPGKFELSFAGSVAPATELQTLSGEVKTSLDSITEPSSVTEKELLKLAAAIRTGVNFYDPICNHREFYGVPGKLYPRNKTAREDS